MVKYILNGLAHAILAVIIQVITGFITGNIWIGAALGIGFYWGREKRDYEIKTGKKAVDVWHLGWFPFEWDLDGINDFVWPLVFCICCGFIWTLWR